METVGASNKPTRQYVDPVRTKNYQDPLKRKLERYEGNIKVPEFKPYTSYHEYKIPDIDPLTGKPRRKRKPRPQPEPAPKPVQKPQPVKIKEPTPEPEPEPTPTPTPSPSPEPDNFTQEFGNTVGSIKRSMGFMFKMDIPSPSTPQW